MWTPTTRRQHSREGLRYETDLTEAEWALIEPLIPKPRARGRPRVWPVREVMNAIFYVLRGGGAWRLLPTDLRLAQRCIAGLVRGATPVCSRPSITSSSWRTGSGADATHRPVLPCSTVACSRRSFPNTRGPAYHDPQPCR
jgi:hypothetical protein